MSSGSGPAKSFAGLSLDRPRVMGIINVTPDSFSDGGEAYAATDAVARGRAMMEAGADILDVGGESTRPGAEPVDADDELRRTIPVVEGLARAGACVSVDTRRARIMQAALGAGARVVNDVTALTGEAGSLGVVAEAGVPVVLMHMRGDPRTMQEDPRYEDAAAEVFAYLEARVRACEAAGIARERIAVDPGIGFGKTAPHNLEILGRLGLYRDLGCPVLIGVSRKSFIAKVDRDVPAKDRVAGSIAAVLSAYAQGVRLFRVHDVAETRQALAVWRGIEASRAGAPEGDEKN